MILVFHLEEINLILLEAGYYDRWTSGLIQYGVWCSVQEVQDVVEKECGALNLW